MSMGPRRPGEGLVSPGHLGDTAGREYGSKTGWGARGWRGEVGRERSGLSCSLADGRCHRGSHGARISVVGGSEEEERGVTGGRLKGLDVGVGVRSTERAHNSLSSDPWKCTDPLMRHNYLDRHCLGGSTQDVGLVGGVCRKRHQSDPGKEGWVRD